MKCKYLPLTNPIIHVSQTRVGYTYEIIEWGKNPYQGMKMLRKEDGLYSVDGKWGRLAQLLWGNRTILQIFTRPSHSDLKVRKL